MGTLRVVQDKAGSEPWLMTGAAGESHVGTFGGEGKLTLITPVLDTSVYATNDVLFVATAFNGARVAGGRAYLQSLVAVDADDQGQAMEFYFFSEAVTLGTHQQRAKHQRRRRLEVPGYGQRQHGRLDRPGRRARGNATRHWPDDGAQKRQH
jgi:hypothetical protein